MQGVTYCSSNPERSLLRGFVYSDKAQKTSIYDFEEVPPSQYDPSNRINISKNGKELGYITYNKERNTINIDFMRNNSDEKNISDKLVKKLIEENPDSQILWDAISDSSARAKARFIKNNPELASKIGGINNPKEVDKVSSNPYNQSGGDLDATTDFNQNNGRNAPKESGTNITDVGSQSVGLSRKWTAQVDDPIGASLPSDTPAHTGRKATNLNVSSERLKSDFDTKIEEIVTTEELLEKSLNGATQIP